MNSSVERFLDLYPDRVTPQYMIGMRETWSRRGGVVGVDGKRLMGVLPFINSESIIVRDDLIHIRTSFHSIILRKIKELNIDGRTYLVGEVPPDVSSFKGEILPSWKEALQRRSTGYYGEQWTIPIPYKLIMALDKMLWKAIITQFDFLTLIRKAKKKDACIYCNGIGRGLEHRVVMGLPAIYSMMLGPCIVCNGTGDMNEVIYKEVTKILNSSDFTVGG